MSCIVRLVVLRMLLLAALGAVVLGITLASAQQPGPTPAQLDEQVKATERTLTIVRQRELEMTRLVALYANRVEKAEADVAQLRIQLEAQPACPAPVPSEPPQEPKP